jgi:serine/threonine-protein kinase
MPLEPGQKFSHYRLVEKIGEGGMGVVWRARDTRLDRDVALKVLPEAFTSDADRLARFEREAKVLASLNHPNIGSIHGLEEADGVKALVLELVEGPTLADRIAEGPIPLDEALPIARQVAEAFEAAHEQGIIHRDLKPANVKVKTNGTVKVLDFGLAKAFLPEVGDADLSQSPTLTARATQMGVIMGTAAYMSPEQARGKPVDKRTDIWAFGCLLYETLTGRQTFPGETVSDTIAAVLKQEPNWSALPASTPIKVRDLLQRCLQKDSQQRLRDIGDARIEIEESLAEPSAAPREGMAVRIGPSWKRPVTWSVLGLLVVLSALTGGLTVWRLIRTPLSSPPLNRLAVPLQSAAPLESKTLHPAVALSPDGTHLVYVARRSDSTQLYLRPMDQFEATPIPGTEGGSGPFFSPDGRWVGFFADGMLKKVSLLGGSPLRICEVPSAMVRGASWGGDDTIVFSWLASMGLLRVSAKGGIPKAVTEAGSHSYLWPEILPGGRDILFTSIARGRFADARIGVLSLETGETKFLDVLGSNAHYAPSGHVVFARAGALLAVPFDLEQRESIGEPMIVVEDVMGNPSTGAGHFSISGAGDLAYVGGAVDAAESTLVWVDRRGKEEPLPLPQGVYEDPRLSPNGQRLAVTVNSNDIWVYDVNRGTPIRLTFDEAVEHEPIWTPDEKRITFSSNRDGTPNLFWRLADGSGEAEQLTKSEYAHYANAWSPDGKVLIYTTTSDRIGGVDTWLFRLDNGMNDRKTEPFINTPHSEWSAKFSPNGRWVAYLSDEMGQAEVYVRPYPERDPKIPISTGGGVEPVWARDGRELFYRNGDKMMVVSITVEPTFIPSKPEMLFEGQYRLSAPGYPYYDVAPDGQRFVMIKASGVRSAPTYVNVVLNWFEELNRLLPTVE